MLLKTKNKIARAIQAVINGQTILYPTDTVWGIGCDARNDKAVEKIIAIKRKQTDKGLIVLFRNFEQLHEYTDFNISLISESTSSRPTSWIIPGGKNLSHHVMPEDGSLAIRIPKHEFCQSLLQSLDCPIVSTSANFHGAPTPFHFDNIDLKLIEQIDFTFSSSDQQQGKIQSSRIIKIDHAGNQQIFRE